MHFCSQFGNCDFNWWWVMACTSSKWGKFWLWSSIWPWKSRSIIPQNNRALNQGLLHLWSKFGDPSLNGWWVIAWTNSWLTDTRTHTHTYTHTRAGNDNTRRSKLVSGKNSLYLSYLIFCFSSGRWYPMSMASTPPVVTMGTRTCSWSVSMSTSMRPQVWDSETCIKRPLNYAVF